MDKRELLRLKYRRQYIIGPSSINCPFDHIKVNLNDKDFLYSHIDLLLTEFTRGNLHLVLLGDIFDFEPDSTGNLDVLQDIARGGIDNISRNLSRYTGSFVLIIIFNTQINIYHDATATKKIYYCTLKDRTWCSSQPHLLAKIAGVNKKSDASRSLYYCSEEFKLLAHAGIGDTTYYEDIHQVLPNHYFDFTHNLVIRFWPEEQRNEISLVECIEVCSSLIKGYMENIANRYKIMLPVTAGKDSRTLLAATNSIRNEVFYYVNREKLLSNRSKDIKIPRELFKGLDVKFNILDINYTVDEDFKKVYYENNFLASDYYLPIIYNYYLTFGDSVNLPGNIATGGNWFYPIYRRNVTTKTLINLNRVSKFDHAWDAYSRWINSAKKISKESGYNIFDLFYWEERLGNWGTQIQLDKEIAQLEFNPFNSRLLVQTMLSLKQPYALDFGKYPLNKGIIKDLWPELLKVPINPGWRNKFVQVLDTFHFTKLFYHIWYR